MRRVAFVVVVLVTTGLALALACGGQTADGTPLPDTPSRDGGAPRANASPSIDATTDAPRADTTPCAPRAADAGCPFTPATDPFYDAGSSSCWARYGGAELSVVQDATCTSQTYRGGAIPPGAYDAIRVEHPTSGWRWRGTIVLMPNATFNQITYVADGESPPTHSARQGTWTAKDAVLTLTARCSMEQAPFGQGPLPYEVTTDACGRVFLVLGVGEARVTYAQR